MGMVSIPPSSKAVSVRLPAGVFDEAVFKGYDYMIAAAGRRGLKLWLTLNDQWHHYGGIPQYIQ